MLKKYNYSLSSIILMILMIFEFLMDPVPQHISLPLIGFIITYVILWIYGLKQRISLKLISYLSGFIISISTLILISLLKGVVPADIIRGIAPFLFIVTFFPVSLLILNNKLKIIEINLIVYLYGFLYSVNNIFLFLMNEYFYSIKVFRITILDPNTLSSVPLFLASFSFFQFVNATKKNKSIFYFISFLIASFAIIVTQTRSLLLCLFMIMIVILIFNFKLNSKKFLKKIAAIFVSVSIILGIVIYNFADSNILLSFINRISNLTSGDKNVTERFDEYNAALGVLSENLLLGGGIGLRFSEHDGVTVNYVHNVVMYVLANIGLTGFLILIFLWGIYTIYTLKSKDIVNLNYYLAFNTILMFSLFFSTYKWFSHNLLLAISISIFLNRMRDNSAEK